MATLQVFNYPHGSEVITRKVIVLNEDNGRIGGIEVNSLNDEQLAKLEEAFSPIKVTDFSHKTNKIDPATGLPYEKQPKIDTFGAPYKVYSKSKIM